MDGDKFARVGGIAAVPVSLVAALGLGSVLFGGLASRQQRLDLATTAVLFGAIGIAYLLMQAPKHGTQPLFPSFGSSMKRAVTAVALGTLVAVLVAPLLSRHPSPSGLAGEMLLVALPALFLLPVGGRLAARTAVGMHQRILIVGSGQVADAVARRLALHRGVTLVGTVDDTPSRSTVGGMAELVDICRRHHVGRIVVAFSRAPSHETLEHLRDLGPGVYVSVVPRMFELLSWNTELEELDGMPLLHVPKPQMSPVARMAKRTLDLTVSGLALAFLIPLFVVIAIGIRWDSPGPVFFRQARTGRDGCTFRMIKFRTMKADAESDRERLAVLSEVDGPIFKIREDPRVTRFGRFLRRTSVDELPQLINVLLGDMSLVGPRPFPVDEAAQITGWPVSRTQVRPGITGLWQVSGRNDLTFDDLRYLDSLYVASWSIWWDLRILLQTPLRVFRRAGAY